MRSVIKAAIVIEHGSATGGDEKISEVIKLLHNLVNEDNVTRVGTAHHLAVTLSDVTDIFHDLDE